ncbi:unnamed protein product [Prorocentrum cordatum]|uniref:Uncharacterized protein n=1 Tax=Prorocentrum cordatum TaxID=2364126 RepID=A0ABN9UXF6_9DINO|nr:unnamed protein product [Polarella glacialis]
MDCVLDPQSSEVTSARSEHLQESMRRLEQSVSSGSCGTSSTGLPQGHAFLQEGLGGLPVDGHGKGHRAASGANHRLGVRPVPQMACHPEVARSLSRIEALLLQTVSLFEVELYSEQDGYSVLQSASGGGGRQHVAAAVASALRTGAELFAHRVDSEVEEEIAVRERLGRPHLTEMVKAGRQGVEARPSGASRAFRGWAQHAEFGAGPHAAPATAQEAKRRGRRRGRAAGDAASAPSLDDVM